MADVTDILTDNLDIWTSAIKRRSPSGRGRSTRFRLYGIEKLRALILDLAVRGKLVPQAPNDEPADALLKKIVRERDKQAASGKVSKAARTKKYSVAFPFVLPKNWTWVQLGDITLRHYGGGTPSKMNPDYWGGDILWASVKDVGKQKYVSNTEDRITELGLANSSSNLIDAGALIIVTRMGLGQVSINQVPMAINQDLRAIVPTSFVNIDFVYNFFLTQKLEGAGLTVKGIRIEELFSLQFPLPPLAEQNRIVAKVDELMGLCDALEAQTHDAIEAHELIVGNLLATLTRSQSAEELAENWARIEDHFDTLFTTEASIDQLKQTILQLAVMGKLVAQDPSDEPAVELLRRISLAKSDQKSRTGDARIKVTPTPKPGALDINLPNNWAVESFENIFLFIDYRGNTPPKTDEGIPLITAKNVRMGRLNREPREYISDNTFKTWMTRGFPKIGDLFFTTEAPLGNVCLNDIEEPFALAQRVICLQPYNEIDTNFIMYALMSETMQRLIDKHATGMTARGIKASSLKPLPIPIPPLAEQHRIVAKINQLVACCEDMKVRMAESHRQKVQLTDALTSKAMAQTACA